MPAAAASFPMSRITLKRICLKHQIPVPPPGYWTKPPMAREKARAALPGTKLGSQRIWVRRFLQKKSPAPPATALMNDKNLWHPCTQRTEQALKKATPDKRGALIATGIGVASVSVPPETVSRALAILDGLITAIEKRGYRVPPQSSPATFFIDAAHVPFAILERFLRDARPPDESERTRRASYASEYPDFARRMDLLNAWKHRPSGKLMVIIGERDERGLQHRWSDRASHKIENQIDDMADEAVAHARIIKLRREQAQRRMAERRERNRQQEQEGAWERERERFSALKWRAEVFERVDRVARLLDRLREMSDQPDEVRQFLAWADKQVAFLRDEFSASGLDSDLP